VVRAAAQQSEPVTSIPSVGIAAASALAALSLGLAPMAFADLNVYEAEAGGGCDCRVTSSRVGA
jgi:hypothetical protein